MRPCLVLLLAVTCHLAAALRVDPPITSRRTLLSGFAAAASLAAAPAFAEQAPAPSPPEVFRPPMKVADAAQQAELEKARSAMPLPADQLVERPGAAISVVA